MQSFTQSSTTNTVPISMMNNATPAVNLMPEKQYLIIKGRSYPDNALGFYNKVYQSIDSYKSMGKDKLTVFFNLECFNTSSAKCIFDLFKKLQTTNITGLDVTVNWYYEEEDEDMLESGEDDSEFFDIKFNLVPFQLN